MIDTATFTLIRINKSRGGGHWPDDDYDVCDGVRVIGRIVKHPRGPEGRPWDDHCPRTQSIVGGSRIRSEPRGCDGGFQGDVATGVAVLPSRRRSADAKRGIVYSSVPSLQRTDMGRVGQPKNGKANVPAMRRRLNIRFRG